MKILIISRTPWNNSNSFGNTFSNLFSGIEGLEIYNICCQNGETNNTVVKQAFQMSDKSVLRSIYKKGSKVGWIVKPSAENLKNELNEQVSISASKKRNTISYIIRDAIWNLGNWKKDFELLAFLEQIKPDVLYLPIYSSPYMCKVQSYLADKLNVPVVGHISDDVYVNSTKKSILSKLYNKVVKKNVKKIIEKCEYLEVFAENMREEYQKIFNKPCYLIGKGVDACKVKDVNYNDLYGEEIKFVYTGNIGTERYKVLSNIGTMLDSYYKNAKLYIYSATPLDSKMEKAFSLAKSISFMGSVSSNEVKNIQQNADFLVHVESFSKLGISSAKMSFSTKIIDYMLSGKPIFAVGPKEINSISVLKKYNLAVVCENEEEIISNLTALSNKHIDLQEIAKNVKKYLVEERDIKTIQKGIKTRLETLISNDA